MYDGEFIEDEAHGVGTFKGVNGEFYQGEWQVDKMHGCGVYKFVGGAKFRGEWKYGKMDGYGVYENLENDTFVGKFEGQFLEGKMDGLGLYYWPRACGGAYVWPLELRAPAAWRVPGAGWELPLPRVAWRGFAGCAPPALGGPLFLSSLFNVKMLYGLLCFPFLLFELPLVGEALTKCRATAYDQTGQLVLQLGKADVATLHEEREGGAHADARGGRAAVAPANEPRPPPQPPQPFRVELPETRGRGGADENLNA